MRARRRARAARDRHRRPRLDGAGAGRGLVGAPRAARTRTATTSAPSAARHPRSRCCSASRRSTWTAREAELDALLDAWPFELVVLGVHVVDGFDVRRPGPARATRAGTTPTRCSPPTTAPCGGRPSTAGSTSSPTSTTSASGGTGRARRRCRRSTRRWTRWPRRARALELNTDRVSDPAGVMYPSLEHPARRARARHPADDRLGRARGGARRPAVGRGHRPRPRGRLPRDAAPLRPRARAAAGRAEPGAAAPARGVRMTAGRAPPSVVSLRPR